jgi:hypothetical protein
VTKKLRDSQELDYKKILVQTATWPTFTPVSSYNLYAELAVLSWLHSHGRWHEVDNLWWVGLLPEGKIVVEAGTGCFYMVLKSFDMAALMWPMEQPRPGVFTWGKPGQLAWKFATTKLCFQVQATRMVSPMTARAEQADQAGAPCLEVTYHAVGEPQDLLEHQAKAGFLKVSEVVLKDVMEDLGLDHEAVNKGEDPVDALVMHIIMAVSPGTTQAQLEAILLERAGLSSPEQDAGLVSSFVKDDHMKGVMTEGDEKEAKIFVEEQSEKQLKNRGRNASITSLVSRRFPVAKEKGAKANQRNKAKLKFLEGGNKGLSNFKDSRWCAKVRPTDEQLLDLLKPSIGRFGTDVPNGCYRIYYPGERVKSVSWTVRGVAKAQEVALKTLWDLHSLHSLEVCPWEGLGQE